jgi:hypothetical protein
MSLRSQAIRRFMLGIVAAGAATALPAVTRAGTLAGWDLTSNASSPSGLAATTVAAPATAAALYQNGGVSANTATYSYDSKGFVAGVQSANVEASLSVGSATNVTDLVFGAFASSTGPGAIAVNYSADGGALVSYGILTIGTASGTSATNYDINFGSLFVNSSLNVFFSAANAVSASGGTLGSSGTFRLNNVGDSSSTPMAFEGAAAAAPVPAPAAVPASLGGMLLLGLGALARRRRRLTGL